jgi:tetratricopeptide (TPR) repeat protein/peroxiredoxin
VLASLASDPCGEIALSRKDKKRLPPGQQPGNPGRRDFLLRCCQSAPVLLSPDYLRAFPALFDPPAATANAVPAPAEFHVHPHYREQVPLEALLHKTQAGNDQFVTEKYAEEIEAIFAAWSHDLRQSSQDVQAIERVLAVGFSGFSFRAAESRVVRAGNPVEVRRNQFTGSLNMQQFLPSLRSELATFATILVAEFQITAITVQEISSGASKIQTRVRYDLVGSGKDFYREQRTGDWDCEWERSSAGELHLQKWTASADMRSRAAHRVFAEITVSALGGNPSYPGQLLHGADYWRTVLDGACGIDVYGHNGITVGDIDSDGFDDLYICQPAGLPNRLFRNRGDGTFEDVTESTGVGLLVNTACALLADIDNDGRQELIVVCTDGPVLFLNEGGGKFRRKPDAFKFASPPQGTFTGAAIADYDRDGWLDIYFCLYLYYQGTSQYKYPSPYYDAQNGPPNFLMRNNRDGTFQDVTAASGLNQNNTRYSFCCGWNDYNRDGWPDLYVVNDFGRKNLYRNNGDGTFTDVASQAGVEDVGAGMSGCWLDYNNDGQDDLYVADMWTAAGLRVSAQENFQKGTPGQVRNLYRKHAMGNSLFRGKGGGFEDAGEVAGVEMGRWAWSSDAWDFDHDGFPDLYVTNGMVSGPLKSEARPADLNSFFWRQVVANSPNEARPSHNYEQGWSALNELIRADGTWSGYERNVFYANNRDGTFSDVSGALGLDFVEDGRSFALADFDHDGRQEVFLKNRNAPQVRVLKNVMEDLPPAIVFRLRGTKSNRDAIGAIVTVNTGTGKQVRTLQAGSGFLAQHSKEIFFGLGENKGAVQVTIQWPGGLLQELKDLPVNHRIWVEEGSPPMRMEAFQTGRQVGEATRRDEPRLHSESLPTVAESWLVAPIAAPDFSLSDLDNKTWSLAALRDKRVLLNFWTLASPECIAQLKALSQRHSEWLKQGLQVLTVNVDEPSEFAKVPDLARSHHFSFPILRASEDFAGTYNVLYRYIFDRHRDLSLPTSFLIGEGGDVVKIYQGPVTGEQVEKDSARIPKTAEERLARGLPFLGVIDAPEFRRNYLSLGSVFFQRGYMEPAESAFQLALRYDPSSAEALYGLGSVYLKQEKPAEAQKNFEAALQTRAGYPETLPNAWNNLGLLATRAGRTQEAVEYFRKALELSPDHLVALENLGNAYRQQRNWAEAQKALERAVEVGPEDPEANYSLGMVFAQTDDTNHAYEYLQNALKFRPGYPEALNNLGVLYLRTRRRDDAIASFEECIRAAPQFDQSYLNLARVYALEGARGKARSVLDALLKQHPDHAQAKQLLEQLK